LNNRTGSEKPKGGSKFSTSLVIGLLLVPLSAVAAVALVNPDAAAEPEEVVAAEIVLETTTTTTVEAEAEDIVVAEIASGDDLAAACGEQGLSLVMKEAEATITPLEQAALDSLRAICLSEGLELPGPPAPDAVVQTVTVVAAPPPGTSNGSGSDNSAVDAAEFEAAYAATVNHINAAIADGATGEKIALAEQLLGEAGNLADAGDYEGGMSKLAAARHAADEANRGSHDDHDDDDDHDEDDDDDEDEHEDDDHDEEDEDEHEDDDEDDD